MIETLFCHEALLFHVDYKRTKFQIYPIKLFFLGYHEYFQHLFHLNKGYGMLINLNYQRCLENLILNNEYSMIE